MRKHRAGGHIAPAVAGAGSDVLAPAELTEAQLTPMRLRHKTPSQPETGGVHISFLGVPSWSAPAGFLPHARRRHRVVRVGTDSAPTRCGQLLQDVSRRRGVRGCHAHVCHTADSFNAQAQAAAPAARRVILRLARTGPAGCCRRLRLAAVAAGAEGVLIRRRDDRDQPRATTL